MSTWKKLVGLLIAVPLLVASMGSFGEDPASQEVMADSGGAGGGECNPSPIVATGTSASGDTLDTSVTNTSGAAEQAYLYGTVQAGGRSVLFYSPIALGAGETATFRVKFNGAIAVVVGVDVCRNKPGGISDAPDPILITPTRET